MESPDFENTDFLDDIYDNDEPEFLEQYRDEINARDRVVIGGGYFDDIPEDSLSRAMMDPLKKFRLYVDAISRNINANDKIPINISQKDIDIMLEKAEYLSAVEHKNPTGYIIGFLCSSRGKKISKESFDNIVKNILPYLEQGSILPPDVIRYGRLWENLTKNN